MAAPDMEAVVNRWIVDFYLNLGLEFIKNEKYEDFGAVRAVLDGVLARPVEETDLMFTKIRVLQFLSLINDGDKHTVSFESDHPATSLESALTLLENMSQDCSIPQKDFEKVCTSIKEMIVGLFIKDNNFDKAKDVLNKHFPKPMVGKKAIFMGLIKQKSRMHKVIEQINFPQFREEMLAFCQRLCPIRPTFLQKAAKHFIDDRLGDQDNSTADEQAEPGPSSSPQVHTVQCAPCKQSLIQKTRLVAAYEALAACSGSTTFSQLEQEMETEENEEDEEEEEDICLHLSLDPKSGTNLSSEQEGLFQRDASSPMEASLADHPPQTDAITQEQAGSSSQTPTVRRSRQLYTLAKLVSEPDSQPSSQNTECPHELETEVRIEKPPQTQPECNEIHQQSPLTGKEVATPRRKHPRRASSRASASVAELSADSEHDPPDSEVSIDLCDEEIPKKSSSSNRNSKKSRRLSDGKKDPKNSSASCKTPLRRLGKQKARTPLNKNLSDEDETCIAESSVDSSPNVLPSTSSTPHRDSTQVKGRATSKWKKLFNGARESKDTWSDEETYFDPKTSSGLHESSISNSGNRKRKWTEEETEKLKEGVKKFGEGNWSKIKSYYSFKHRTNVNLKDRWRTLKKLNMI